MSFLTHTHTHTHHLTLSLPVLSFSLWFGLPHINHSPSWRHWLQLVRAIHTLWHLSAQHCCRHSFPLPGFHCPPATCREPRNLRAQRFCAREQRMTQSIECTVSYSGAPLCNFLLTLISLHGHSLFLFSFSFPPYSTVFLSLFSVPPSPSLY